MASHGPNAARERAGTLQAEVQDADPLFRRFMKKNEVFQKDLLVELLNKGVMCADDISTLTKPEYDDIVLRTKEARRRERPDTRSMDQLDRTLKKFYKLWCKEAGVPRSHADWDGMPRTPKTDREPTILPASGGIAVASPRAPTTPGGTATEPELYEFPVQESNKSRRNNHGSNALKRERNRMGGSSGLNRQRSRSPSPRPKAGSRPPSRPGSRRNSGADDAPSSPGSDTRSATVSSKPVNRSRRAQTLLPTPKKHQKMSRSVSTRRDLLGKKSSGRIGRDGPSSPPSSGRDRKKKGNKRKNRRTRDAEDAEQLQELQWTCGNGHTNLTSHMFCPSCGQSQEQAMARKEDHWDEPEHIAFVLNSDVGRNFALDAHGLELQMHHLASTCIPKTRWHQGSYDGRLSLLFCVDAAVSRRALFRVTEQFNKLMEVEPNPMWLNTFGYISLTNNSEENRQAIKRLSLIDMDALARLRAGSSAVPREAENPEFFGILCKPIEFPQDQTPILLSEITRGDQKTPMEFPEKVALIDKIVEAVLYLHENDVSHGFLTTDIMWVDPTLQNLKIFPLVPIDEFMQDERITDQSFRLWLAPESLATQTFDKGADLYMLANIMWEILVQDDPFFGVASATESNIKRGWHPNVDYIWEKLEEIEDLYFTQIQKLIGIMKSLWSRNPGIRPLPNQLRDKMATVKRGMETVSSRNDVTAQQPVALTPSQIAARQNAAAGSSGMVSLIQTKPASPVSNTMGALSEEKETGAETAPASGGGLPPAPGFAPITPASPRGLPPPPSGFAAPVNNSPAGGVATILIQSKTHYTPPPTATAD